MATTMKLHRSLIYFFSYESDFQKYSESLSKNLWQVHYYPQILIFRSKGCQLWSFLLSYVLNPNLWPIIHGHEICYFNTLHSFCFQLTLLSDGRLFFIPWVNFWGSCLWPLRLIDLILNLLVSEEKDLQDLQLSTNWSKDLLHRVEYFRLLGCKIPLSYSCSSLRLGSQYFLLKIGLTPPLVFYQNSVVLVFYQPLLTSKANFLLIWCLPASFREVYHFPFFQG